MLLGVALCVFNASFVAQDGQRYYTINDDALISLRYAWNLAHGHGLARELQRCLAVRQMDGARALENARKHGDAILGKRKRPSGRMF